MDAKQKAMVWGLAALGLGGVLYLITRKPNSVATSAAPYYRTYNIPGVGVSPTGTASGLPTIPPAAQSENDCGCTSANGGQFYASLNDMLDIFKSGAGAAMKSYQDQVYNNIPSFVSQYFNNPQGGAKASASILTNPFQYAG